MRTNDSGKREATEFGMIPIDTPRTELRKVKVKEGQEVLPFFL